MWAVAVIWLKYCWKWHKTPFNSINLFIASSVVIILQLTEPSSISPAVPSDKVSYDLPWVTFPACIDSYMTLELSGWHPITCSSKMTMFPAEKVSIFVFNDMLKLSAFQLLNMPSVPLFPCFLLPNDISLSKLTAFQDNKRYLEWCWLPAFSSFSTMISIVFPFRIMKTLYVVKG